MSFTVVGLLKKYSMMQGDWDELEGKNRVVFIPLTTMEDRFVPTKKLTWLNAEVKDTALIDQTGQEISNVLIHMHRGLKDFRIETRGGELKEFNSTKAGFDFTGQAIGFVTLLIGGVGIANLMLASVSERMREIGLCKAVGASNGDIFVQILAEAVCLSAIGGLMGVGSGRGHDRRAAVGAGDVDVPPAVFPSRRESWDFPSACSSAWLRACIPLFKLPDARSH